MTPFFLLFAYLLGGVESLQWGSFNRLMEYVSLSHASDRGYWNPSGLGEFLVASARSFIDEKTLPSSSTKTKWSKLVPIKVNDFSWRLALGKLSTLHNLLAWGLDVSSLLCPICDSISKNRYHLFFSCHLVVDLSAKVLRWWGFDNCLFASFED